MAHPDVREQHGATRAHYAVVMRAPGAGWFVATSALARLPIAMASLAFLLYVQRSTGTFADSGIVSGSALVGIAAGSVVQGRLIDRFGIRATLGVGAVVFTAVAALNFWAVEASAPVALIACCAFAFGVAQPAVSPASRAIWGKALPRGPVLEAALTYEAISLEIFFILGPALAGVLASMAWAGTGLLATVALLVTGTLLFISGPLVRRAPGTAAAGLPRAARHHVIRIPGMRTIVLLSGGFGILLGTVEVVVPAVAVEAGQLALGGILIGAWSLTSVLFGVIYASRPWPAALHLRAPVLLAAFALLIAAMAIPPGLVGLAIAMMVAGTLITPQATLHSLLVDRVSPPESSGEAFAWILTAVTLGLGAGQAAAGSLVAALGPSPVLAFAALCGLLVAAVAWTRRGTLLPLSGAHPDAVQAVADGSIGSERSA